MRNARKIINKIRILCLKIYLQMKNKKFDNEQIIDIAFDENQDIIYIM